MKFHVLAASFAVAAGLLASTPARSQSLESVQPAYTGLLVASPNPVNFSLSHGLSTGRWVTVTNYGQGNAGPLLVDGPTGGGPPAVYRDPGHDYCTNATLGPGQSCQFNVVFDSSCPQASTIYATFTVSAPNGSAPTLYISGKGVSKGGSCE